MGWGTHIRLGLAAMVLAMPALASGQVPLLPATERFADHAACVAALVAHQARERGLRTEGRVRSGPDAVREVRLIEGGIERVSDGVARYASELWYHHGARDAATGRMRIAHSYERRDRRCDDAVMTTTGLRGFTQPTFE